MFKVGDKVKIISVEGTGNDEFYLNKIGTILENNRKTKFNNNSLLVCSVWIDNGPSLYFNYNNLELIQEEPMKYINVKEITIASLIKANGGSLECAGLRKAIRWGYSEYMEDFHSCLQSDTHISWDWLYPKIMDRPNYMSFLIDKGFIREVEPEVFYAKGDKFRHTSNYNIWTLSIHWPDATAMLVSEDGEVYNAPVTVSNSHKITRSEFKQICANNDEYFTKIEG